MSETPILTLDEMEAAQSQPHLIVNAALRALEVFGQIVVKSKSDPTESPLDPTDGDAYIVQVATGIPEWALYETQIAYYASGWYFLPARSGWIAYVEDEDAYYRMSGDSPPVWEAFTLSAGAVDAYDVDYASSSSPGPSSGVDKVGDALDDLYALIEDITGFNVGAMRDDVYDLQTIAVSHTSQLSSLTTSVATNSASITTLATTGIPLAIPGKPGAGALYHIQIPVALSIPASLAGTTGYSGTNATGTATFTLYKNGVSFGTVAFGSGSSAPTLTSAAGATFAAGDRLTIEAPASQDATLANVGFTLKATRTL